MDFEAAVQNVAYATTATGGNNCINNRKGIGTRLGLRTEESDEKGVGAGVSFGTENNRKNSMKNDIDARLGNGTNVTLQTDSFRDGIGRLGIWREKAMRTVKVMVQNQVLVQG